MDIFQRTKSLRTFHLGDHKPGPFRQGHFFKDIFDCYRIRKVMQYEVFSKTYIDLIDRAGKKIKFSILFLDNLLKI